MDSKEFGIRILKAAAKGALAGITQEVEAELDKLGDTRSEQLYELADRIGAVDDNKTGLDDLLAISIRVAAQLIGAGERRQEAAK